MIPLNQFQDAISRNIQRVNQYQNACDGTGGKCDCIGLIIGAVRLAGEEWPWTHGSNYAARYRSRNFRAVSSAGKLRAYEMVFKAREPGDEKWKLPESYRGHSDQRDYYHVGIVVNLSPLQIVHCTGVEGGIQIDSKLGQWRFAGELNLVDYDEGVGEMEQTLYKAIVQAENGKTVRMRERPTTKADVTASIPLGTEACVLEETDETWSKVGIDGQTGYMMRQFLKRIEALSPLQPADPDQQARFRETLVNLKALLVPLLQEIEKYLVGGS